MAGTSPGYDAREGWRGLALSQTDFGERLAEKRW